MRFQQSLAAQCFVPALIILQGPSTFRRVSPQTDIDLRRTASRVSDELKSVQTRNVSRTLLLTFNLGIGCIGINIVESARTSKTCCCDALEEITPEGRKKRLQGIITKQRYPIALQVSNIDFFSEGQCSRLGPCSQDGRFFLCLLMRNTRSRMSFGENRITSLDQCLCQKAFGDFQ